MSVSHVAFCIASVGATVCSAKRWCGFVMALRARLLAAKHVLESPAANDELSRIQSAAVLAQLQRDPLTAEQAADLSEHVVEVPWRCNHREMIIAALQSRVSAPQASRRKEQDFMTFIDFLSKLTWDIQLDQNVSSTTKMDQLCSALIHLKCPNPSAHTLKLATSLHLFCSIGFEDALSKSRAEKGKEKDVFRVELKRHARNAIVESEHYLLKLPLRLVRQWL